MKIELMSYKGEFNRINKQNFINEDATKYYTGSFKNSIDYFNPTFIINNDHFDFSKNHYNYCKIADDNNNGKYYFITNIVFMNTNIVELELKLDVLYSNKDFINELKVILSRHESLYDKSVIDSLLPTTYDYITTQFSGSDTDFIEPNVYGGFSVFISVVCDDLNNNSYSIYNIPSCKTFLTSLNDIFTITKRIIGKDISSFFTSFFVQDRSQCITSIVYIPILPNDSFVEFDENGGINNAIDYLPIGTGKIEGSGLGEDNFTIIPIFKQNPKINGGKIYLFGGNQYNRKTKEDLNFYELSSYSKYELYIPFYGWVELDTTKLNSRTELLKLTYNVNLLNGHSIVSVDECYYEETLREDIIIQNYCYLNCMCGVQIPLGSGDGNNIIRNVISQVVNTAVSVGSVIAGGKQVQALADFMGETDMGVTTAIRGYFGGIKDVNNTVKNTITNTISNLPIRTSSGTVNGGYEILNMIKVPIIKSTIPNVLNYNYYNHMVGRPSTYNGLIKDLPNGEYGVVSSIIYEDVEYISNYSKCLISEYEEIVKILKSGFYK